MYIRTPGVKSTGRGGPGAARARNLRAPRRRISGMGRRIAIGAGASAFVVAAAALAFAGEDAREPDSGQPDGRLVLALLGPERLAVANPRSGVTAVRRVPGGTLCGSAPAAVGGRVLFGRGGPVTLGPGLRGRPRSAGRGHGFVPSAVEGRIWALTLRGRRDWRRTRVTAVRELDLRGRVTRASRMRPPAYGLFGATEDALVFQAERGVELWDIRSGARVQTLPDAWPVAVGGPSFAWCPGEPCRRVHVRGGATIRVPEPTVLGGGAAAFSPDGSRLALALTDGRVAIADTSTGAVALVPRARLGDYPALAWSPSGDWLYIAGRNGLLGYRPGDERPRALPIRTTGTVMQIDALAR
jgi:hypothetical protein